MSTVNQTGLVSEIDLTLPLFFFIKKMFIVFIWHAGLARLLRSWSLYNQDLDSRDENFPILPPRPGNQDETFFTK